MTPRRQKPSSDKVEVPDADSMLIQTFRLHCQKRHPRMRFRSRGEHDADHRLHDDFLDHVHAKEVKGAGAGEQDQDQHNGEHDN